MPSCPVTPREAALDVSVVIDDDGTITVSISDETGYAPDLIDDALKQAGAEALRVYRELHPAKPARRG